MDGCSPFSQPPPLKLLLDEMDDALPDNRLIALIFPPFLLFIFGVFLVPDGREFDMLHHEPVIIGVSDVDG